MMRKIVRIIFLGLLGCSLFSGQLMAQTKDYPWQAELSGTALDYFGPLTGEYFRTDSLSFGLTVGAHAYVNNWLNLSFNSSFVPTVNDYPISEEETKSTSLIDVSAMMQLKSNGTIFEEDAFFAPFISTGFGLNSASNINRIYIPAALGLKFRFSPTFSFQVQGTYKLELNEEDFQHVAYSAGLVFALPGTKTKPEEEEEQPVDVPPAVAENSKDSDQDGVVDSEDQCPDEPGLLMYMGCPSKDNTVEKEDLNNKPSNNLDNFVDNNTGRMTQEEQGVFDRAVQNINFESGTANLTMESEYVLDSLATILNRYPEYSLKISGHTDNTGSSRDNKILSVKRAFKVKYFLSNRGVKMGRITSDGYGDTQPISNNDTEEGRSLNRRVEFELLNPGEYSPPIVSPPSVPQGTNQDSFN